MNIQVIDKMPKKADFLVSFITEGEKVRDITGKTGETVLLYNDGGAERNFYVGLGGKKDVTTENIRRAISMAVDKAKSLKVKSITVNLPDLKLKTKDVASSIVTGAILGNYDFDKYITDKERKSSILSELQLIVKKNMNDVKEIVKREKIVCESAIFVRDLVNENASDKTPVKYTALAKNMSKENNLKISIIDEKKMEDLKMGLILGVARGSVNPPRVVIVEYNGKKGGDIVALVGKGVTFDSGGLNLKPTGYMETMKMDMAGSATVLGAIVAASKLKIKQNIVAVLGLTENMPGDSAQKPGDVVTSYSGQTVEIANTDAEGRLVLGDVVSYTVKKYKPKVLIDLATLTGAVIYALGDIAAGIMGNDQKLIDDLITAGKNTDELLWQLPIYQQSREDIKSEFADFKNVGHPKQCGPTAGAVFIEKFVGDTKWAHLDIAGTAHIERRRYYIKKGATGYGVRLLVDYLSRLK